MADAVQVPDDIRLRLAHGVLQLLADGATPRSGRGWMRSPRSSAGRCRWPW